MEQLLFTSVVDARSCCVREKNIAGCAKMTNCLLAGTHGRLRAGRGNTDPDLSLARAQIDAKPSRMSPLFPSLFPEELDKAGIFLNRSTGGASRGVAVPSTE